MPARPLYGITFCKAKNVVRRTGALARPKKK